MSTLISFPAGSNVKIHHYEEGFPLERRLSSLGLVPGESVTIVRNDAVNPLIIAVKGARFMLGRAMCHSVFAEESARNGDIA